MSKRILNIVGHDILEYNRISLFNELGFSVFTTGVYTDPSKPDSTKPYLPKNQYTAEKELLEEFYSLNPSGYIYGQGRLNLSKEFINKFDVILASWICEPLVENWNLLKDKIVLYESLGQSDGHRETYLSELRKRGVKVIRMSEGENYFPNYAGADATIDLEVDTDYYQGWQGAEQSIFTVNSALWQRKHLSNADMYLEITRGLPIKLYGSHNETLKADFCYGKPSTREEILEQYQKCRVYFSLGTRPCPVVLSFKEAMSVGCPVITWGPTFGGSTFTAHTFIENGVSGFYSDSPDKLRAFCQLLLKDYDLAKTISKNARKVAEKNFSKHVIKGQWREFFKNLGISL